MIFKVSQKGKLRNKTPMLELRKQTKNAVFFNTLKVFDAPILEFSTKMIGGLILPVCNVELVHLVQLN